MANSFNFDRVIANVAKLKQTLPKIVANETKNYFLKSFETSSFGGKAWKEPKRKQMKGSSRNQSKTLVQSGALRRAVAQSLVSATFERIMFKVDGTVVPYAIVHNEGLRAGRGAGFQMPKRQYMGQTNELSNIQIRTIINQIDKVWI